MAIQQGTAGNDSMNGNGNADTIQGGGGDDTVLGAGGNDIVDGGAGTDMVRFRGSFQDYSITWDSALRQYRIADQKQGRDGVDYVSGVEYFQFDDGTWSIANLVPGEGDGQVLLGTEGDDQLVGGVGYDTLRGEGGNDLLEGAGSGDVIEGGSGSDTARFSGNFLEYAVTWDSAARQYTIVDMVAGRDGADTVSGVEYFQFADGGREIGNLVPGTGDGVALTGTAGDDQLMGDVGYDTLQGLEGNDMLAGGNANDVLDSGDGNDYLTGGHGNDQVTGGAGTDTVSFSGNSWEYDISWDAAARQYTISHRYGPDGADVVSGVEYFNFWDGQRDIGNLVYGMGDGMALTGTAGGDQLTGDVGYDTLQGLEGNDVLDGRNANDILDGGSGDDFIMGGQGDDQIAGGEGDDRLLGGEGYDQIDGGAGTDIAFFSGNSWEYDISWDATARQYTISHRYGLDGADFVSGVEYFSFWDGQRDIGNLVYGMGDGVALTGTAGDDQLMGDMGYDTLQGLEGNDLLDGRNANDVLDGGDGNDYLVGGQGHDQISGGAGTDTVGFGGNSWEYDISWDATARQYTISHRYGPDGTDTVSGVEYFNFWDGQRDIGNLVYGTGDGVALTGTAGDDQLTGDMGYDTLQGLDGNDVLDGGGANDVLEGGAGSDTLVGGNGADRLLFGAGALDGQDLVAGFLSGLDRIELDSSVFAGLTAGTLAAEAFHTGDPAAMTAETRILFDAYSGALSYDMDGSGEAAALQFATVSPDGMAPALTNTDFFVY